MSGDTAELRRKAESRLAALEKEREEVMTFIRILDAMSDQHETQPIPVGRPQAITVGRPQAAPYKGKTLAEAAAEYLSSRGGRGTTKEICAALLAGGFETAATRFYQTVYTTLFRRKDVFEKIGEEGWSVKTGDK